jgi:hypothetical protein
MSNDVASTWGWCHSTGELSGHKIQHILQFLSFCKIKLVPSDLGQHNFSLPGSACCLLHVGFLLGLLFTSEDGGNMLLQNVT